MAGAAAEAGAVRLRGRIRVLARWWRRLIADVDHVAVLARVQSDGRFTSRYAFMVLMSAGIAILGLLLSSPAVVIGAMLVSPLMGPIIGLGFALAVLDWTEVRRSLAAIAQGSLLAVGFTALIVFLSPLKDLTSELLARTRPNLFDLLVATFSALAGAYATIRGRGETIVGVSIATALMPPLATVGYGLATLNRVVFLGAAGLFLTNLVAIALSSAAVARLYGFGSGLSPQQTRAQTRWTLVVFIALAVPLGISLRHIAWEAWATQSARAAIGRAFGPTARLTALEPDFRGGTPAFRAVVVTEEVQPGAEAQVRETLGATLGRPVDVAISQVEASRGSGPAALAPPETGAALAASVRDRLVLAAGVPPGAVFVDSTARRVRLQGSGDPSVAAWWELERRLRAGMDGWGVEVVPPVAPLPLVAFAAGSAALSPEAEAETARIGWALARWGVRQAVVTGRAAGNEPRPRELARARAEAVAAGLLRGGIAAEVRIDPPGPRQRAAEPERGRAAFRTVEVTPAP